MDKRCKQQERDTHEQCNISNVVGEYLNVDEVNNGSVEPSIPSKKSIDEVADGSAKHQSESHSLDATGCVAEHVHDQSNNADCHDREQRTPIGEDRKACTGVECEPELHNTVDDDDRAVRKCVDGPRLRELVHSSDSDANRNRELPIAQPRCAACTVVVAYGIASSRASGIGSPVTSHIP